MFLFDDKSGVTEIVYELLSLKTKIRGGPNRSQCYYVNLYHQWLDMYFMLPLK